MAPAIQKIGLRRRSNQASPERLRAGPVRPSSTGSPAMTTCGSLMTDPRIQDGVEDVHQQARDEVDHDEDADNRDHERSVFQLDPHEKLSADARNVEDPLGDDRASDA